MLKFGMIYLLDAYNVIHKIRKLRTRLDESLAAARHDLASLCIQIAQKRADIECFQLVFDGRSEYRDMPPENLPKVFQCFSLTGESADQKIIEILDENFPKNKFCVVSDDNFVCNHARIYHANVLSVTAFESFAHRVLENKRFHPTKKGLPAKFLSQRDAQEITEAYRKELGL